MVALATKNLSKTYGSHTALHDFSIQIPEQSILGLLGPNGAGKTTLIRIINQIIRPDAGSVELFGEPLAPGHIRLIGYLPEERGLYRKMKVGEQLLYFAQLKGMSRSDALKEIRRWFEHFGMVDWWGKLVEDLSKGMAQKVQFVNTIVHRPKLLILDEPFTGFDPVNARIITEAILKLRDEGATVIFSTHRMETVESLCDRVVMLNKSVNVLEGTRAEIRERFSTNLFSANHRGPLNLPEDRYEVQTQPMPGETSEGLFESRIRLLNGGNSNTLLHDLMQSTEVLGFRKYVPSMADIFIRLVDGESNEDLKREIGIHG